MTADRPPGETGETDETAAAGGRDRRVRSARPTDADRIRELQSHLRQPNPDLLEYGLAVGATLVSVAAGPTEGRAEGGRVVGYLLPVDAPNRAGVHLAELVVDPEHRRAGRARGLLSAVIDEADGPVTLRAHPDNDGALALYDEFGFEVVDRHTDAYADGDALSLRLE